MHIETNEVDIACKFSQHADLLKELKLSTTFILLHLHGLYDRLKAHTNHLHNLQLQERKKEVKK